MRGQEFTFVVDLLGLFGMFGMFGMFMSSFFVCVSESDSQALSNGNGMPVAMKGHETHIKKQMGLLRFRYCNPERE